MIEISLNSEVIDKLKKMEHSIEHWSIEHTKLSIQIRRMVEVVDTLYDARKREIDQCIKAAGHDPAKVKDIRINENGKLVLELES